MLWLRWYMKLILMRYMNLLCLMLWVMRLLLLMMMKRRLLVLQRRRRLMMMWRLLWGLVWRLVMWQLMVHVLECAGMLRARRHCLLLVGHNMALVWSLILYIMGILLRLVHQWYPLNSLCSWDTRVMWIIASTHWVLHIWVHIGSSHMAILGGSHAICVVFLIAIP